MSCYGHCTLEARHPVRSPRAGAGVECDLRAAVARACTSIPYNQQGTGHIQTRCTHAECGRDKHSRAHATLTNGQAAHLTKPTLTWVRARVEVCASKRHGRAAVAVAEALSVPGTAVRVQAAEPRPRTVDMASQQ
jgi:hypothetical protein